MRHLNKNVLRGFYIILVLALLITPSLAAENGSGYRTGPNGIALIKRHEGFSPTAEWDYTRYAIGYGCSYDKAFQMFPDNPKDEEGMITLTEEQAEQVLMEELLSCERSVGSYMERHGLALNQNQFDALVSFTYNLGSAWMTGQNSDGTPYMIRDLLENTPSSEWTLARVQEAFGTWINAGGKPLDGLIRRRADEAKLFVTPSDGGIFIDVGRNEWYAEYVEEAYELGIMTGNGDGTFAPEKNMIRAELVTALAKYVRPNLNGYTAGRFYDVSSGDWFAREVAWAAENGIVNGVDSFNFSPNTSIERERICNIIARYLRSQNVMVGDTELQFTDEYAISLDAVDDVYYCAALGIVNGNDDGTFAPQKFATRAEVAKMLTCMAHVLEDASNQTGAAG